MEILKAIYNNNEHGMVTVQFDAIISDGRTISGSYCYESNSLMTAEDIFYYFSDESPKDTHHIAIMDSYPWWEEDLSEEESDILNSVRNWIDTRF